MSKKTKTEGVHPELELTIQDIGYRGRGVARDDARVIFVPGVIEGETVRARITHTHKRFADAELLEIVTPSPHRITPECPLALRASSDPDAPGFPCVGCAYQHVAYEEEVRLKQKQLQELLRRMAKLETVPFADPVGAPQPLGYRNKITLHGGTYQGQRVLGYVGANNHSVLDVPRCLLAHEAINARLAELRAEGETDHGSHGSTRMAPDGAGKKEKGWLQSLRRSATVTLRRTETDGVLDAVRGIKRLSGELTEKSAVGDLTVPASGFYQVNPAVADLLVKHVQGLIEASTCGHVLDLFCGVGVFGLVAGLAGKRVWGIDSDERAIHAAQQNAKARDLADVSFESGNVEECLDEMLTASPMEDTLIILDPPRSGLEQRICEALVAAAPCEVIYVSCAPDTLSRDLTRLALPSLPLKQVKLFDMFPRTACFETVVHMARP